jgi:hypothetical protein
MNNITTEHLLQGINSNSVPIGNKQFVILAAWISTLLLSKLPLVIARDLLGTGFWEQMVEAVR